MTIRLQNHVARSVMIALVAAFAFASGSLHAQDKVYPLQGATASGKLVEINKDQITIEVRGKNQVYKVNEVKKVSLGEDPPGMDRARDFTFDKNYNQALDELKKIDPASIKDPIALQDYQFYRGFVEGNLALAGSGAAKTSAATLLMTVKRANANSHHTYRLNEMLGQLAVAVGKPDSATPFYREMASAPYPEIKALAFYRQGEVELALNKLPEARKLFEQLIASEANDTEMIQLKNLAEVGLALCSAREGKSEEALAKLQELVQKHDSSDQALFASIYNAQGLCLENMGKTNQAILAYLHTDLLFFTSTEAHAEALYHLSKLFPKANLQQRGIEARERLTAQYPSSTWAAKQ